MFLWQTVRGSDGCVETVDGWETLDTLIAEMARSAWEEPGNVWANYVTDEATGEVLAVTIFGPGLELLVAVADGRQLRFPVPEFYRELWDWRSA